MRPLRIFLREDEPRIARCAVDRLSLQPGANCHFPGTFAELFELVFARLNISYQLFKVRFR